MYISHRSRNMSRETFVPQRRVKSPENAMETSLRKDGRTVDQMRPLFMKTSVVKGAAGSAYVEMNHTKVLVAVHGPKASRSLFSEEGRVFCDFSFAPFAQSCRRRRGMQQDEKEYALIMVESVELAVVLSKYPKNVIEIYVMVLEDDGSVMSASLNAASLALADAGIEMYDLVTSCTLSFNPSWIVDPVLSEESRMFVSEYALSRPEFSILDSEEDLFGESDNNRIPYLKNGTNNARGGLFLGYMPSLGQVTYLSSIGSMPKPLLIESVNVCVDACTKIYAQMQGHLSASLISKWK